MSSANTSDVLIIGGGVVGLSIAFHAARAGARVRIIERDATRTGASFGNAGLVVPSYFSPLPSPGIITEGLKHILNPAGPFSIKPRLNPAFLGWLVRFLRHVNQRHYQRSVALFARINLEGLEAHNEMAALGGDDYLFSQPGLLYLFLDRAKFAHGRQAAELVADHGIVTTVLDAQSVHEAEPLAGPRVVGGIDFRDDMALDPGRFITWLAGRCNEMDVETVTGAEVYGFSVAGSTTGSRVTGAATTRGRFKADQIVLAPGAWLGEMASWLGARLPMEGGKGLSLTFNSSPLVPAKPLLLDEAHIAVNPMGGNLRVTGVMVLSGTDLSLSRRRVEGLHRSADAYLPGLAALEPDLVWRGLRPCTPDGLPVIGRLRERSNVIVAGGHDTRGMSLAPLTGRYVTKLLNGQSLGEMTAALSPDRFSRR